jgi:hypothetical protein
MVNITQYPSYTERSEYGMYRSFDWILNNRKVLRLKYDEELYPQSIEEILLRMFVFREGSISKTGKPRVENNRMRTKEDFLLTVRYYYPDLTKEQLMDITKYIVKHTSFDNKSRFFSYQYCPNVRKLTHYASFELAKEKWYQDYFPYYHTNYAFDNIGSGELKEILNGLVKELTPIEI